MTLPTRRVFVTGASGAGSTTLARALGTYWSSATHDTDDYFWMPTNPPYADRRPKAERAHLMQAMFAARSDWVLSGSLMAWGEVIVPSIDAIIFLRLDPKVRLARLFEREHSRFGADALAPGGPMHEEHLAFMEWAAGYDRPSFSGRNLARHREWLAEAGKPVIELDSATPTSTLVTRAVSEIGSRVGG